MARPPINLKYRKYGKLKVLSKAFPPPDSQKKNKSAYWLCQCACGNQTIVSSDKLRQGHTRSCGCLIHETAIDVTGQKFGKLLALQRVAIPENRPSKAYFLCRCDCGKDYIVSGQSLRDGVTKSCGCLTPKYTDPEQCRLHSAFNIYKNRYRDGDLSFEDFLYLTAQNCFYCNTPPSQVHNTFTASPTSFSYQHGAFKYTGIDRISSDLPHLKSNCVPCCLFCNYLKGSDSLSDFYDRIIKIYHNAASINKHTPPLPQFYEQIVGENDPIITVD